MSQNLYNTHLIVISTYVMTFHKENICANSRLCVTKFDMPDRGRGWVIWCSFFRYKKLTLILA